MNTVPATRHPRVRGLMVALLALLVAQPLLAREARAWWNGDWPDRMKIDADAGPKGAAITDPIGRTQVLIRLHSGNFNFATTKEDGSDIRFVAGDDKTPLKFHIARFDPLVDQVGLIWVDIPDLAPGASTPFFMYWGNKGAVAGGDPHGSYDADQLLVYQFGDENGVPKDLTANGINALTGGKRDDTGITGFALRLDGTAPVRMPQTPLLALVAGQAGTWSTWFRVEEAANSGIIYTQRDANGAFTIGLDHGIAYAEIEQGGAVQRTTPGVKFAGGSWHLLAVVADAGKLNVMVDGAAQGLLAAAVPAIGGQTQIGGELAMAAPVAATSGAPDSGSRVEAAAVAAVPAPLPNFTGLLGEFEIAKAARPLGALQLAYREQGANPKLLSFEQPEEASVLGNGFLAVILKSVTPDAWVVIGILAVLFAFSWVVMVGKLLFMGGQGRANAAFRREFVKASTIDAGPTGFPALSSAKLPILKKSPLFNLYHVATEQLDVRIAQGRAAPGEPVPEHSLHAIRSALEACSVREHRRLNNLMVVLTIAIAGGPFIGLLGTVIGVMITFAAIAIAGDVNVNAIAPGISAALLATVAGLTVAIPALFGYNYFTIRIGDASSELHVFIEELITRMGEGMAPRRHQDRVTRHQAAE